ncbi:hypothetical protein O6H91_11G117900 [Diphasiastrum complanatum]|uniref:Uncharacterized protein n=1 Tax=Diphasiastrum complanatum TaxID=34168 RepID=A0ACC2CD68_DIPCM|nr:hypothetical protein O6H91_11G117900 [Diphasiastrum complanatum]
MFVHSDACHVINIVIGNTPELRFCDPILAIDATNKLLTFSTHPSILSILLFYAAAAAEEMVEKLVDVVVFGASGYTGKHVVREILKFADAPGGGQRRIAIAGRSKAKLTSALDWALAGKPSPVSVYILEADVGNPASLASLCNKTRLLLNCVGPYRLYGEPVFAACVEAGIDYLDVSGEPDFMERMEFKYGEQAKKQGSLMVSACGFDCIPAELGVLFNSRQFAAPALPQTVNSYLVLESKTGIRGNIGTWESLVLGVANEADLKKFRKSRPRRARLQIPGVQAQKLDFAHWEKNLGSWAAVLPAADASVVRRTLATVAENPQGLICLEDAENAEAELVKRKWQEIKPVQYGVYIAFKRFIDMIPYFLLGALLFFFARFKWAAKLLIAYPELFTLRVFTKKGPTEEEVKNAHFQMWFFGKGFSNSNIEGQQLKIPDKQIVTRVCGPEIGYVTTPIILVQAALIVLDERKSLPKGGVLTPGAVFGISDLQERLEKNGITFEVVSISKV